MDVGRAEFGPVRIAWGDSATDAPASADVLRQFGEPQVRRHAALNGPRARLFLTGRWLLASMIAALTDDPDWGFTTTCERCGSADHGRARLERAPVAVSVSYAGGVVAVAAVGLEHAAAVGVDIERPASGAPDRRLDELAALFAPAPPPDIEGWALLEAALKADGRGVLVDLAAVHVGAIGSGLLPHARAVRIPGRDDSVDAATIDGPAGLVLTAAVARVARASLPA